MKSWRFTIIGGLIFFGILLGTFGYKSHVDTHYRNFRVVERGKLYRSGQLDPTAFDRIIREHAIKTVITFRDTRREGEPPPDLHEEEYCESRGIAYFRLTPKRWGAAPGVQPPVEDNIRQYVQIIRTRKSEGPILIHCFAGIHRTGAYTAIYRMEFNSWTNQEALREMQDLGYTTLEGDPDILEYIESYVPRRIGTRPPE